MTGLSIIFDSVSKVLSPRFRITALSLFVDPCEFVCLLGPSGSGKSTILAFAGGWLRPDSGRILFGQQDVTRLPAFSRPVRTCFQKGGFLFPHLSVAENVAYALRVKGIRRQEAIKRATAILDQVGLTGFERRRPLDLSGGEIQRVSVARALADPQPVLLLDEMTAGLDRPLRSSICDLVSDLIRRTGVTTIYVTHDVEEAFSMTARFNSRIAIIDNGTIVQVGPPAAIYRKPASRFVAGLMGETNFLPIAAFDGTTVQTVGGNVLQLCSTTARSGKYLSLRPECIRLHRPNDCRFAVLSGKIEKVEFAGAVTKWTVRCAGDVLLTTAADNGTQYKTGDQCMLYVSANDVCVLSD